jgi:hypothetical protein
VFVHDSWFRRCCLGSTEPFTAIGLASDFVPDQEEQGLESSATALASFWSTSACRASRWTSSMARSTLTSANRCGRVGA